MRRIPVRFFITALEVYGCGKAVFPVWGDGIFQERERDYGAIQLSGARQKALLVKPGIDQRDGEKIVGSRCGLSAPCILMEELDRINYREYNCIVVDEAQFLTKAQVQRLVEIVDDDGIPWCAMACARISAANCSRVANGCSPGRIPLRK